MNDYQQVVQVLEDYNYSVLRGNNVILSILNCSDSRERYDFLRGLDGVSDDVAFLLTRDLRKVLFKIDL